MVQLRKLSETRYTTQDAVVNFRPNRAHPSSPFVVVKNSGTITGNQCTRKSHLGFSTGNDCCIFFKPRMNSILNGTWRVFYRFRFPSVFSEGRRTLGDLRTYITHKDTGLSDKYVYRVFALVNELTSNVLRKNCWSVISGYAIAKQELRADSFEPSGFLSFSFQHFELQKSQKYQNVRSCSLRSYRRMIRTGDVLLYFPAREKQSIKIFYFALEKRGEVSPGFTYARTTKPSAY